MNSPKRGNLAACHRSLARPQQARGRLVSVYFFVQLCCHSKGVRAPWLPQGAVSAERATFNENAA
jgi:hypothetical protein